jgi:hypothetical protein
MSNRALVYRCPPNSEHKAAQEFREAGIRAYVPRDRGGRRSPFTGCLPAPAPSYVFPEKALSTAYAKHVRGAPLGWVDKRDLRRLYLDKPKTKASAFCPYTIGQAVNIGDIPGTVAAVQGETCIVAVTMLGKQHLRPLHYSRIRPG